MKGISDGQTAAALAIVGRLVWDRSSFTTATYMQQRVRTIGRVSRAATTIRGAFTDTRGGRSGRIAASPATTAPLILLPVIRGSSTLAADRKREEFSFATATPDGRRPVSFRMTDRDT